MMKLETLKNLADTIQSALIALGIIIGGVWALYRFRTLEIEKAQAETEKAKRELISRGVLEMELTPSQLTDGSARFIHLLLKMTNLGTGVEYILWEDSSVQAALVSNDGAFGTALPGFYLRIGFDPLFSAVSPKQTKRFSYLIPVSRAGVYLIDAQIAGSKEEVTKSKAEAKLAGLEGVEKLTWGGTTYFRVT